MIEIATYGSCTENISISTNQPLVLSQDALASFPDTSKTANHLRELAQSHFNAIFLQKEKIPKSLEYRYWTIAQCSFLSLAGVLSIAGFICLFINVDKSVSIPLFVVGMLGLVSHMECHPCTDHINDRLRKLAQDLVEAQKEIDKCMRLCHLINQLAAMQKSIQTFTAQPHQQNIKGLFDQLEDSLQQTIVKTDSLGVCNLILLDEITRVFKSEKINLAEDQRIERKILKDLNAWKNIYLGKLSKEESMSYYKLIQQGNQSVVPLIKKRIDQFFHQYQLELEEKHRTISLTSTSYTS
jgi:hypothetical protein